MKLSAWGRFPVIEARPLHYSDAQELIQKISGSTSLIPFGNGRSYGDSALAATYIPMRTRERMLAFDEQAGLLTCEAGVLLSEVIAAFLPKGWFLRITPGTKFITVGGAIASDVHGKNHHVAGCFSECVHSMSVLLPSGEIQSCVKGDELFHATCGGMGLTGVILDARIALCKVSSKNIEQRTIKTRSLRETFEAFEQYAALPYSVAWIDCMAKGDKIGKGLLKVGDFATDDDLTYTVKDSISVCCDFPSWALNKYSISTFNRLYYHQAPVGESRQRISLDDFFYPLDSITNWNRLYGKAGFTQYQFVLPKDESFAGLNDILKSISQTGKGSFLAVLKLFGKDNENYLSFPMEGYSLALDFKIEKGIFTLLDSLDQKVLRYGGRIYLAKDVRVGKEAFEQGYPHIEKFRAFREKYGMNAKFNSLQSDRLGL